MSNAANQVAPDLPNDVAEACALASTLIGVSETPALDVQLLVAFALDQSRTRIVAHPERRLTNRQRDSFVAMLTRRQRGEPIAYITGVKEFWSLPLRVTPAVLIPRPETELLVAKALQLLDAGEHEIAEIGTGSGAVAIAIASERPNASVFATDIVADALEVARSNAAALLPEGRRVRFLLGDACLPLAGRRFDMLVSNPPYVAEDDPHLDCADLTYEPGIALRAGADGLDLLRRVIRGGARVLRPGGHLLLEHGYDQAPAVAALLRDAGFGDIDHHRDLSGHPRVTRARLGLDAPRRNAEPADRRTGDG